MDEKASFFARVMSRFVDALRDQANLDTFVSASKESALDWALAIWRECMRMETESGGLDRKTIIAAGFIKVIAGGKKGN